MKKYLVFFAVAALALSACGGGGGGDGDGGTVAKTWDITGVLESSSASVSVTKAVSGVTVTCRDTTDEEVTCTTDEAGKFICPCTLGKIYECEGPDGETFTFDEDGDGPQTTMVSIIPCYPGVNDNMDDIDLGTCDESGKCNGSPLDQIDRDGDGISDADDPEDTTACSSNSDCPPDRICSKAICDVRLCSKDSDCPSDRPVCFELFLCISKCGNGTCDEGETETSCPADCAGEKECTKHSDCLDGKICNLENGTCLTYDCSSLYNTSSCVSSLECQVCKGYTGNKYVCDSSGYYCATKTCYISGGVVQGCPSSDGPYECIFDGGNVGDCAVADVY